MASDHEKKPMLYADLFKRPQRQDNMVMISSSTSSSSTNQWSSCDSSSSSGFSTPLYSDLSDQGDFVAELSRQMAECIMLQEEEEEEEQDNTAANCEHFHASGAVKDNHSQNQSSNPLAADDDRRPHIQVYELKNQAPISKEDFVCTGRRVKGAESAQQKQVQKAEQHFMQYRGRGWGNGPGQFGSGMQAVFLGGSGSTSGSTGTGVFLPRNPTELKRKPGCSMVLMPTRVLQTLELHFNRLQDSTPPPPLIKGESSISSKGLRNGHSQAANNDEMQLPQEWIY